MKQGNNVYFICKHCGQKFEMKGYLDFDDFDSGNFDGSTCEIALKCGNCKKYNGFAIRAFATKNSSFAEALNKDRK